MWNTVLGALALTAVLLSLILWAIGRWTISQRVRESAVTMAIMRRVLSGLVLVVAATAFLVSMVR